MDKTYLSPAEVAKLLRVATVTVRMWAQKGMLKAETTPGGHRRYRYQEIKRFAAQYGISLQTGTEEQLRILVVDDEVEWSGLLAKILMAADDDVITELAADGFEAGRKIHSFRPHVILLDLKLPGIDGIEVCRSIKADPETQSIRVIGITGFMSQENEDRLLQAGAECCLSKPVDEEKLLATVGLVPAAPGRVAKLQ
ncbi:MAG: response regulator [Gammaproteobacteria bacterium]|nr:response regulator [Gammaproteobacteria bacterium]